MPKVPIKRTSPGEVKALVGKIRRGDENAFQELLHLRSRNIGRDSKRGVRIPRQRMVRQLWKQTAIYNIADPATATSTTLARNNIIAAKRRKDANRGKKEAEREKTWQIEIAFERSRKNVSQPETIAARKDLAEKIKAILLSRGVKKLTIKRKRDLNIFFEYFFGEKNSYKTLGEKYKMTDGRINQIIQGIINDLKTHSAFESIATELREGH